MHRFYAIALFAVLPIAAEVKVTKAADRVKIEIDGKPYSDFIYGGEAKKPFLHPLRSASGKIVTRVWPMEEKDGEAKDHVHHQGLWFTHGDVNGLDFWANHPTQKSDKKGIVTLNKLGALKGGKKLGLVAASFDWKDPKGEVVLTEDRLMTFHSDPNLRIIDFDIKLTGKVAAKFGDTKEGFFALRLTAPLDARHSGKMTSAEGAVGEKKVWGKRSPWVDYAGELEGEKLGVTIMDHPGNLKHPTYWHSRDYGLFAANVFGEHDFYNDKSRDGSVTLEPGKSWRFRYRLVIHPGDAASAGIAKMYEEWSKSK